ncbi:hypothetical protein NP493_437g03000 [Ridgeia piscesae]|uniref:RecA family profile 1 domain-containing protein n=1 Tax=Ridgeia piscesae TaxID=27915 RepID=A0AAD9NRY2_RIDPI|nr:hypothetical protein NP493_437g03000 [Ridgeia piscesae]
MSLVELLRVTGLSANDISTLKETVAQAAIKCPVVTALQLHQKEGPAELSYGYLSTGCQQLDKFLRGGLLSRGITEIAGESASGKTQLCIQMCLTVQLPHELGGFSAGAVYICTEDVFPNKRLVQMVDLLKKRCHIPSVSDIKFTDNIFIEHAAELDDLSFCINKKLPVLLAKGQVKLIVIDSIAALFRCDFSVHEAAKRAKQLSAFAAQLTKLNCQYNAPVICVNQVSDVIHSTNGATQGSRKVMPSLGICWANLVTCRLMLSRTNETVTVRQRDDAGNVVSCIEANVRNMEVMFAPHLPNTLCRYIIDHDGVKALS